MTHVEPNAAQRIRDKVAQARLPAAQKKLNEIVAAMEASNSLVARYRGPFDSVLVGLLKDEGFVVKTDHGTGACNCDYTVSCDCDTVWVTVSVPE